MQTRTGQEEESTSQWHDQANRRNDRAQRLRPNSEKKHISTDLLFKFFFSFPKSIDIFWKSIVSLNSSPNVNNFPGSKKRAEEVAFTVRSAGAFSYVSHKSRSPQG